MNNEKQRITIAEACGIVSKDQWGPLYHTENGFVRDCPDYPECLNAMHEAEKVLTSKQKQTYATLLSDAMSDSAPTDSWHAVWSETIHATAAQRAEAFLRTVGKWAID